VFVLLRALKRRLTIALGAGVLLASIVGLAAWFLVPQAKYKAQAVLQVEARPPQVLFRTVETQNPSGGEEYARYQKTQMGLVKTRFVLSAALRQPVVKRAQMIREQQDPVKWLQEKLDVSFETGSELLNICLSGDDPKELADVVNAVKDAYMNEVVNKAHTDRQKRYDKLKELQKKYAEMMKGQRQKLKVLADSAGSDNRETLALEHQLALERLGFLKNELLQTQSQKRKIEAELKLVEQTEDDSQRLAETDLLAVSEAEVEEAIERDPVVGEIRDRLSEMQSRLRSERVHTARVSRKGVNEPALRALSDEVESLKKSLEAERKAIRPTILRQLTSQGRGEKQSRGGELRQQLAVDADVEARLNAEIERVDTGNRKLTRESLELESTRDDISQTQLAATEIGKEVEALSVELEAPRRINTFEDAVAPSTRDEQKRYVMIALITFASFFGGLFGVAFLEVQTQKIDTADQVALEVGLPIVGALPLLPAKARRGGLAVTDGKDRYWHAMLHESIDATRTMLVHAARAGSHRVVMVTSAQPGEGKTSLASHLATSLARTGHKTLLIDADLRRPAINRLFDLPPAPGLSELLRGEVTLDGCITPTFVANLPVVSAGKYDESTLRILAQGGLGPIFSELKEQFDFVIVDSSPVLPVADGLAVAQQVDAVLFSVLRDVSRKTKVFAAYQRLETLGATILGAVVTGTRSGVYGDDYYAGQYYASTARPRAASPKNGSLLEE
jgi:capsular exopolysaccharide synthesis family protein